MHEYYRMKEVVQEIIGPAGFKEDSEELMPDVFGSAHSEFSLDVFRLRLIWDGKDGVGYVQTREGKQWKDIPCYVAEAKDDEFQDKLAQLQAEIKLRLLKIKK